MGALRVFKKAFGFNSAASRAASSQAGAIYIDAEDNPFTRDTRARTPRSRGRNRPANDAGPAEVEPAAAVEEPGFDAGILPPAIAREEEAPRRTRGRRRPRPDEGGEEALEAVS